MIHRDDINSFVVNINFRLTSAVLVTNKTRQNCRELKSASASQFDLIIESDLFLTQIRELWRQSTNIAAKKNEPWKSDQISLHHAHDIPVHCYVISKTLSSIIRFDADNKSQPALDFKLVPLFFSVSVFSGWQTLPLMLPKNRKRLFFSARETYERHMWRALCLSSMENAGWSRVQTIFTTHCADYFMTQFYFCLVARLNNFFSLHLSV